MVSPEGEMLRCQNRNNLERENHFCCPPPLAFSLFLICQLRSVIMRGCEWWVYYTNPTNQ